jgi:hypothetical protein
MGLLGEINSDRKRFFLVVGLDFAFYLLFIPLNLFSINLVTSQFDRVPLATMGLLLHSVEGTRQLLNMLLNVMISLIASIVLFFFLNLANLSVCKVIIWRLQLKRKVTLSILLKSVWLTLLMSLILLLPLIAGAWPLIKLAKASAPNLPALSLLNCTPLLIVLLLVNYLMTLSYYGLAKTESVRKAIGLSFGLALGRLNSLFRPFIFFWLISMVGIFALWHLKSIFGGWIFLVFVLLVFASAVGRHKVLWILSKSA